MDYSGITLTLRCGTRLSFPIQLSNNLPIMLTETMLHPKAKSRSNLKTQRSSSFISFMTGHYPFQSLLNTSTYPILPNIFKSALPSSIYILDLEEYNVRASPKFINRSILSKRNWNMSPAQKELFLWHYYLGHADLNRIQCILCKPHGKEKDNKRHCLVTPRHKGSSSVDLVHIVCEACQLAK